MIRRKKCLITKLLLQKLLQNSETAIEKCVGFFEESVAEQLTITQLQ